MRNLVIPTLASLCSAAFWIKILLLLFYSSFANADAVEDILAKHPRVNVAILVENLKTGEEIYAYNPKKLMIPASTVKALTAFTALKYLGSDFVYKTQLLKNKNDLYLKFSGDPSLTLEDLRLLMVKIPQNINKVYLDDSAFDQNYYADGWSWEDSKFCFAAPVSSIIIDRNCFNAVLEPSGAVKSNKIFAKIHNKLQAKADSACAPDLRVNLDSSFDLTGCINSQGQPINLNIAYQNPRLMIQAMLKKKVTFKKAPEGSIVIAQVQSAVLSDLIKKMQKDSDNIYANAIAKTIAARYYKLPGDFSKATKSMMEIAGLKQMRLVDGSGTSRYNLMAPDHFVAILKEAHASEAIWPAFSASLPIAAEDGTLEKRFIDYPEFHGKIRAKTGSMGGVYSLVGYVNESEVFAIMINGFTCPREEMANLAEELLAAVIQNEAE